jgi:hypothetical protein
MLLGPALDFLFLHLLTLASISLAAVNSNQQIPFSIQSYPNAANNSLGIAQEGTGVLSHWARNTRSQFFSDITQNRASEWVIVMGNEAGGELMYQSRRAFVSRY